MFVLVTILGNIDVFIVLYGGKITFMCSIIFIRNNTKAVTIIAMATEERTEELSLPCSIKY